MEIDGADKQFHFFLSDIDQHTTPKIFEFGVCIDNIQSRLNQRLIEHFIRLDMTQHQNKHNPSPNIRTFCSNVANHRH